jgi:enamine deaminase RidA (YjgF/YER057c/UK114 family)
LHWEQQVVRAPVASQVPADAPVPQGRLLGGVCHGAPSVLTAQRRTDPALNHGVLPVATPLLGQAPGGGDACLYRRLYSDRAVQAGERGAIRFRTDGDFVFGVVQAETAPGERPHLEADARKVYDGIFELLRALGTTAPLRLWRVWNYLSDINRADGSLERYRQFNLGRAAAFDAHWAAQRAAGLADDAASQRIPAACGIGTVDGGSPNGSTLAVAFLASTLPFVQIENPRQVSAYRYPSAYGPASPTFSRAILAPIESPVGTAPVQLFVSGTASIVGHQTVHPGDAAAQCRESLRNIGVLLEQANRKLAPAAGVPLCIEQMDSLVYVRRERDFDAIRSVVAQGVGRDARVHYVRADICRDDLLVEIESTGPSAAAGQ